MSSPAQIPALVLLAVLAAATAGCSATQPPMDPLPGATAQSAADGQPVTVHVASDQHCLTAPDHQDAFEPLLVDGAIAQQAAPCRQQGRWSVYTFTARIPAASTRQVGLSAGNTGVAVVDGARALAAGGVSIYYAQLPDGTSTASAVDYSSDVIR